MSKKVSEMTERLIADLTGTELLELIDEASPGVLDNYKVSLNTVLSLLDPVFDAIATDITALQGEIAALKIYDVAGAWNGTPAASDVIVRFELARALTFPDDFAGAVGIAGVAATGVTVFDVKKNGANVGTITWAAAGTVPTFATTGAAVSFAIGDVITVVAPATPDATLANIAFTLVAARD